ncbi:ankyrin repeat domain-containing protein [Thalassococcus lentus]|uniref:Ankyrin repeat domain-containing protein n=1 Tax=Thalassococcus lentus TaxID=1210524 RepID=A0ABT4XQD4_9RHOB|nr:ankyrin repeat domain-containing protein [Thalassococcus lentus]MDA7424063.1 ankyrin repeat domain-containing protein [Thalassococcus lentus]
MTQSQSTEQLRRDAKRLKKAFDTGEAAARHRVESHLGARAEIKLADALHVVARETLFESWPALVKASETLGLDRAAAQQRLKFALYHGQNEKVSALLDQYPDLNKGAFGLSCALYDQSEVARMLADDPGYATRQIGPRRPILHLAFSRWHKARPDLQESMVSVADMLLANGADVNDGYPFQQGDDHLLSALYGAIGHADNMVLGRWLLDNGADPNDGESLYHATELGHHDGLRMLLEAGANPHGTNALLRAMDFHDHTAVEMLIAHGAQADDFNDAEIGGEQPWVCPALHQAARRSSDARMTDLLIQAGADPNRVYRGANAYGFARVHGNRAVSRAIEAMGATAELTPEEVLLARAADGLESPGQFIDPAKLPEAYRHLIREILHLPGRLGHVKRLVALGLPFDAPDSEGLTPLHVAGWEGLPEVMQYFINLQADLSHVNGYGGTLLSTIIHGSENNPSRQGRDYLECLRLALTAGVALPRRTALNAGRADISEFLRDWAMKYPGQVV